MTEPSPTALRTPIARGGPWVQLAMVTVGFAVNFWAWALISPLGPLFSPDKAKLAGVAYDKQLSFLPFSDGRPLTASQASLMVAVPVVVGSIGRIPAGLIALAGLVILIYRRRVTGPVFSATTKMGKVVYDFLAAAIVLGVWNTLASGLFHVGGDYNYRDERPGQGTGSRAPQRGWDKPELQRKK